jgi:hypothetical protein
MKASLKKITYSFVIPFPKGNLLENYSKWSRHVYYLLLQSRYTSKYVICVTHPFRFVLLNVHCASAVIFSISYIKKQKSMQSCLTTRHDGAWGDKRYSSYSFSTSALDGGQWSGSRPGLALAPRKGPPVPIVQEAGWAPELVWTQRIQEKSFCLCRASNLDCPVVKPVARHYTDWATRLTIISYIDRQQQRYKEPGRSLWLSPSHSVPTGFMAHPPS